MTATKRLAETDHRPGWRLFVNGRPMPSDTEWEVVSSEYGSVETAVIVDANGSPVFDRPVYREAPHVNIVAWGRASDGGIRIGVIRQPRPHADDPEHSGNDHEAVVFGQVPMGFIENLIGESVEEASARETAEETGATAVVAVTRPGYPWHCPNPTFVATWADLCFIEVDLKQIEALSSTRNEPIYSAEYIPPDELLRRIRDGKDSKGAVYRSATSNSVLMVFFATHPEFWPLWSR